MSQSTTFDLVAGDATWLTEDDLNLLIALADLAEEFTVTWAALAATTTFPEAVRHLDELTADITPLLADYRRRFPPADPDARIPAIVDLASFLSFAPQETPFGNDPFISCNTGYTGI